VIELRIKSHAIIIVRRSLNLSKTYLLLSIVVAANGIVVSSSGSVLPEAAQVLGDGIDFRASLPLLSIPLMATGALTLTVPVILLFVYDRNNGVLERFLSLGMSQADIYKRYLKASILITMTYLPFAIVAYIAAGLAAGTNPAVLFEASVLIAVLGISVATLVCISMMSFSTLQKERVGASQPVGIGIGGLVMLPYYVIPLGRPAQDAVHIGLIFGLCIGAAATAMLILSSRLISREKLLP
jgi:hypothetical protein